MLQYNALSPAESGPTDEPFNILGIESQMEKNFLMLNQDKTGV